MKKIWICCLMYLIGINVSEAQLNIALNQIFKPNIRVRYQFLPDQTWGDSTSFGYQQLNFASIIPLGGNAEVKLKELKVQAHQTFLNLSLGGRQAQGSDLLEKIRLGGAALGITHVRGRVGKGVWIYSAQIGALANTTIQDRASIFGLGAIAKLQIKGLRKQNIYGLALAVSPRSVIPVPIIGWNRKLAKKWDMSILLPVQANISYSISKKTTLEWQNGFTAIAFPTQAQQLKPSLSNAQWAQYIDIRSSIELTQKFNKSWHLMVEAGFIPYRGLQWNNAERKSLLATNSLSLGGFASVGLRLNLQQGWLSSQIFESE